MSKSNMAAALKLLTAGVVLTRYVLTARNKHTGERRVVAWAEAMSELESLALVQEWLLYCASVTPLAAGCDWVVDIAKDGE